MNKSQLQKLVGHVVKLDPAAMDAGGSLVDDDWRVTRVTDDAIDLQNEQTGATVVMGPDGVYSYFTDAARSTSAQKYGTLQLHMQVTLLRDGRTLAKPLPPPKQARGRLEDEIRNAVESLRREHEFNEDVSARAGSDELGTPFSVDAIRNVLASGLASRFGREMHDALLRARGAMENANQKIEASMRFQRGSNAWAGAVNAASKAIVEARGPLVTLRAHLKHVE